LAVLKKPQLVDFYKAENLEVLEVTYDIFDDSHIVEDLAGQTVWDVHNNRVNNAMDDFTNGKPNTTVMRSDLEKSPLFVKVNVKSNGSVLKSPILVSGGMDITRAKNSSATAALPASNAPVPAGINGRPTVSSKNELVRHCITGHTTLLSRPIM
ncbi:UNVERIFIED_CONTAM: hypothetical protein HDU68_006955, partial [Siphonaria sp. JEL0065]